MNREKKILNEILEICSRDYIIPEIEDYYRAVMEIKEKIENYHNMKTEIESARAEIQALEEQQNQIYQNLVDTFKFDDQVEPWVWEYCFNCKIQDKATEYVNMCREKIYGCD